VQCTAALVVLVHRPLAGTPLVRRARPRNPVLARRANGRPSAESRFKVWPRTAAKLSDGDAGLGFGGKVFFYLHRSHRMASHESQRRKVRHRGILQKADGQLLADTELLTNAHTQRRTAVGEEASSTLRASVWLVQRKRHISVL
jgi:hypothetical protein